MMARAAGHADLPALVALVGDYAAEIRPGGQAPQPQAVARTLRLLIDAPRGAVWMAERDGRAVGILAATAQVSPWADVIVAEMLILFVRPEARRSRAAHGLLSGFERWAASIGAQVIGLTDTGNILGPAVSKRGYVLTETKYLKGL